MFKLLLMCVMLTASAASANINVNIAYFEITRPAPPVLSNLDPIPVDLGLSGARLGISDNQTTGKFLGQDYTLEAFIVDHDQDPMPTFDKALTFADYILVNVTADQLLDLADTPSAQGKILFNIAAQDGHLRDQQCRSNVLHTIPSYAMRADALMQSLLKKRWTDVALIYGTFPTDRAFADAVRGSIKKFGLRLRSEKEWVFDADMRRTASNEIPIFTQGFKDHDVLIVADEVHDFGRYVAYNTWLARPIAGSEGLRPLAWDRTVEQWGAAQLQSRFDKLGTRSMKDQDYAAWTAVRVIGEAVTRTTSADPTVLRGYIFSDDFKLAGFKGRPLSFRTWNGQLRQPIPVVSENALVSQAPLDGFLHQRNELDTLGLDLAESQCTEFKDQK